MSDRDLAMQKDQRSGLFLSIIDFHFEMVFNLKFHHTGSLMPRFLSHTAGWKVWTLKGACFIRLLKQVTLSQTDISRRFKCVIYPTASFVTYLHYRTTCLCHPIQSALGKSRDCQKEGFISWNRNQRFWKDVFFQQGKCQTKGNDICWIHFQKQTCVSPNHIMCLVQQWETPLVRHYDSGQTFIVIFPDGTGQA